MCLVTLSFRPAVALARDAKAAEWAGDPYLLKTDPVSGEVLGDKPVVMQHEGRELRFASEQNAETFKKDPAKYLAKVDAELIKQQLPVYPLDVCPVTGEKLGGMGEAVNVITKNRLVRLCCPGCRGELAKNGAAIIAKLDAAVVEKQMKDYPLQTCAVLGGKLGEMGEPVNVVVGNRLVRLCCGGCVAKVRKDPLTYLAKIDAARPR